jgi:hypothetical protein
VPVKEKLKYQKAQAIGAVIEVGDIFGASQYSIGWGSGNVDVVLPTILPVIGARFSGPGSGVIFVSQFYIPGFV